MKREKLDIREAGIFSVESANKKVPIYLQRAQYVEALEKGGRVSKYASCYLHDSMIACVHILGLVQ